MQFLKQVVAANLEKSVLKLVYLKNHLKNRMFYQNGALFATVFTDYVRAANMLITGW